MGDLCNIIMQERRVMVPGRPVVLEMDCCSGEIHDPFVVRLERSCDRSGILSNM